MNAPTAIEMPISEGGWIQAIQTANAWRGRALNYFGQAEAAVCETLAVLAAVPDRGAVVRLRRPLGQRLEVLDSAIGPSGPFGAEGKKAAPALAEFRKLERLRPFLSHGAGKVTLDQKGQWLLVLKLLDFQGGAAERSVEIIEQREAEKRLTDLKLRTQRLEAALRCLRDELRS